MLGLQHVCLYNRTNTVKGVGEGGGGWGGEEGMSVRGDTPD